MNEPLLLPYEVDKLLRLNPGHAKRLARRGLIPAVILPDGKTIRFKREVIDGLLSSGSHVMPGGIVR